MFVEEHFPIVIFFCCMKILVNHSTQSDNENLTKYMDMFEWFRCVECDSRVPKRRVVGGCDAKFAEQLYEV